MSSFKIRSDLSPKGDQPEAIKLLSQGISDNIADQVLLGVTGSGKTFTMAHVIEKVNKPTLIIAPNKTLAAQLYNEFKILFPENAVEYFVSYYDYFQPEAYIPSSDTYIQKDSSINEMIDKLRHSATMSVLSRTDVIVVASVSCIYGLGAPEDYLALRLDLETGMEISRKDILSRLIDMQYDRNDVDFHRGVFRVRGDRVEIVPAYEEDRAVRIEMFGDVIESLAEIDPLKGNIVNRLNRVTIFPASHYLILKQTRKRAIENIIAELKDRIDYFRKEKKFVETQRIEERTNFDLEMIQELGYCNGIENYSRHLTGRKKGEPPPTLLDYYPDDFLLFIDESHIAIPQLNGMSKGDRSRKETLVEYGFRLPSALDNRPLKFDEFSSRIKNAIYVSATPADYEIEKAQHNLAEQISRPTGLLDPAIKVRKGENQVDNLLEEIQLRISKNERVLVTTLTKRMAEDLTDYYTDLGIKVRYLHSDIKTMERTEIIRELRIGTFDVLIGINLLREGLDIPEVSLVAILDADKEGFLRSARSLIQTCGRAARNVNGTVLMYADKITKSMQQAIDETERRRSLQEKYNQEYNIIPETIKKEISEGFFTVKKSVETMTDNISEKIADYGSEMNIEDHIKEMKEEMGQAAKELDFEKAAFLRDKIRELNKILVFEI
ncbi:MAG: excinuclease ABC subunit UvrB [Deltaproteobacteria bacterium]|nr:excinuclease ABC subunit UvrB [Deltaproteobacteria bacterium]MBW2217916.1 excinuclease ABC subunit UvrB [Deltaproteobacteria bacterium]